MCRFVKLSLITALLLASSISLVGQGKLEKGSIEVKGLVVAQYEGMLAHVCYHVCGLSLIVKLDNPIADKYVIVSVEYMDVHSRPRNGMPVQLISKSSRWAFYARPNPDNRAPLQRYMNIVTESGKDVSEETAIPAWVLLKGAENEKLPFGEPVATYNVGVGKFQAIK